MHDKIVNPVFILLIILLIIVFLLNKFKQLNYIYVILLPFWHFMFDLGVTATLDRVVVVFMILIIFLNYYKFHIPKQILFYTILTIFISIIFSRLIPLDIASKYTAFRGQYRWVGQVPVFFLNFVVPITYLSNRVKNENEIIKIFSIIIYTLVIMSIFGLIQFIIYYIFKLDIFPIGFDDERGTPIYDISNLLGVVRVCSIGGEPKNFAFTLIIGILILYSETLLGKNKIVNQKYKKYIYMLFLTNLILTFSTQGFIMLIVGIFSSLLFSVYIFKNIKSSVLTSILTLSIIVIILYNIPIIRLAIEDRTIKRITEQGAIEDYNLAINGFLNNNPFYYLTGVGLGHIHLYAQNYIPEFAKDYMTNNVFVGKHGYLRIISDSGIVGLFSFLYISIYLILKLSKKYAYENENIIYVKRILALLIVGVTMCYMMTNDGPGYLFTFFGLGFAILRISKIRYYNQCVAS